MLTDKIYSELRRGLNGEVSYDEVQKKYGAHKGSFYGALGRFFVDAGAEVSRLSSEHANVNEKIVNARNALKELAEETEQLRQEKKEKEGQIAKLEQKRQGLLTGVEKLEATKKSKEKLIVKLEHLEELGFNSDKLEKLGKKISEISARRGVSGKSAADKFFRDLKGYDAKLAYEIELGRLKAQIKSKESEVQGWQAESKRLELECASKKALVETLEDLAKQGVGKEEVLTWHGILGSVGVAPNDFEKELVRYGDVERIVKRRTGEIKTLENKVGVLQSQVEALEKRKAEIESSIGTLTESGVGKIQMISEQATGELSKLEGRIKVWGDKMAELGELKQELQMALLFAAISKDPSLVRALPQGAVIKLQAMVISWFDVQNLNPKTKVPDWLSRKYWGIDSWAAVGTADLLRWAYGGMLVMSDEHEGHR